MAGVDHWHLEAGHLSFGLQASRSRSLPWMYVVRLPKFGRGLRAQGASQAVAGALSEMCRRRPVLRMHVEVWSEDASEREAVAGALAAQGFRKARRPRIYTHTIWMDLRRPEHELFASLHPTGRRHVRAAARKGFAVCRISRPELAPKLEAMIRATFERTGGSGPSEPWADLIELSNREDAPVRILGLFKEDDVARGEPVGFVMGVLHGDVAEYVHAASVRDASASVPILYAPTWELMRWARARGAQWWDFGGVPDPAKTDGDDPLAGITDFKGYFSRDIQAIGEEWIFEPHFLRGIVTRLPSALKRYHHSPSRRE